MMQIIPAIDLIGGQCVRLTQGDYGKVTTYGGSPLEMARMFEGAGCRRLHLVDLDGARAGQVVNWKVLEEIAGKTSLEIDFGGGVKQDEDLRLIFEAGAAMATVGSVAVKEPARFAGWLRRYGGDRILLGADVKGRRIAVAGWQEQTEWPVLDFIAEKTAQGVTRLFCTDIAKDGALQGPSLELYEEIIGRFPDLFFIASGGVSDIEDLERLRDIGCKGAIVGKALYEGRIRLGELAPFLG